MMRTGEDCPVCLVPHDPEIHAATVAVHRWFRAEIKRRIRRVRKGKLREVTW